jgi:hypothetical protein
MERIDNRTETEKRTHRWIVVATDKLLSWKGFARDGLSYAGWACETLQDAKRTIRWVSSRTEMLRVRLIREPYRPNKACVHFHIYVVRDDHPSLMG